MRRFISAAVVLFLSSCGGEAADAPAISASAIPAENARGELRLDWSRDIGAYSELLRPTLAGDIVCAVNARGEAFFLRLADGGDVSPPIEILKGGGVIAGAAGCDGEIVAAAREDGVLAAYSRDGEELWRREMKTRITSPPLVADGNVFVLGHDGRLGAYSARRGDLLWRYVSPLKNLLRTPLDSSPTTDGGRIYAGIDNGVVVALRREDGRVAWNTRLASPRSSHSFANILDVTTPARRGDIICAAAYQGHIGCMRAADGELLWRAPLSASRRAAIDLDAARVFAADIDGGVRAYSARDGEELWRRDSDSATAVAFVRGALLAGTRNNSLTALAPDDGRVLDSLPLRGAIVHLAAADENSVLGATLGGQIFRATFVF
ncbi:MAG: PQQ-binding-like beta-propeller repeat protein [Gammaproteobacteria bacterium]